MDPLTAIAQMIASICSLTETIIKSQPPEVQKAEWERHNRRMDALEKFFNIGGKTDSK